MTRRFRPTIRLRLTLTYAALFFVAGALLLGLMYVLLDQALRPPDHGPGSEGGPPAAWDREAASDTDGRFPLPTSRDELQRRLDAAREEQRTEALRQVQIQAGIALLATSIVALGLGWLYAGRMLQPVRQITTHARQFSQTTLDQRIGLTGANDELKELADTIDAMLDRLEQAFASQGRFAAQASHELRTPLAIMGAEADVVLGVPDVTDREQAMAGVIRTQVLRSEKLVTSLLVLAKSESTMREHEPLDLADIAGDVMGELITAADIARITVDLELESAPTVGDETLLRHLILNMVSNAIRHNVEGGFLTLEVFSAGPSACIRVSNSGAEIPAEELDQLFQPFRRGLDSRSRREGGFGLGLAIIRSVTQAHGGEISAMARPEGGLTLTVCLPLETRSANPERGVETIQ